MNIIYAIIFLSFLISNLTAIAMDEVENDLNKSEGYQVTRTKLTFAEIATAVRLLEQQRKEGKHNTHPQGVIMALSIKAEDESFELDPHLEQMFKEVNLLKNGKIENPEYVMAILASSVSKLLNEANVDNNENKPL